MATRQNTRSNTSHVDAVVVGSGAAGALVAAKLAAKGKKVVILESGRSVQPKDMVSSDIFSRWLHWGGDMAELQVAAPVTIRTYLSTGSQTGGTAAHVRRSEVVDKRVLGRRKGSCGQADHQQDGNCAGDGKV